VKTRQPTILDALNMEHALEFSYRAHHAECLDYLCLFRSTGLTLKAYFFDEGSADDVVVPHNHRYDFDTRVVRGSLCEQRFYTAQSGMECNRFLRWSFNTPVDGGVGFHAPEYSYLYPEDQVKKRHSAGESYFNRAHADIHTLTAVEPGTILLITQFADRSPWTTFAWSDIKPRTAGLYDKMTRAQVIARAEQLQKAMECP
jgi:hypothetical protein